MASSLEALEMDVAKPNHKMKTESIRVGVEALRRARLIVDALGQEGGVYASLQEYITFALAEQVKKDWAKARKAIDQQEP